jgi:hypothetical protein
VGSHKKDTLLLEALRTISGNGTRLNKGSKTMKQPIVKDKETTLEATETIVKKRDYSKVSRRQDQGDLHIRPDGKLLKRLRAYCAKSGENISDVFAFAVRNHLNKVWQTDNNRNLQAQKKAFSVYKTKRHIIDLYLEYNPQNKWKFNDDEVAYLYNDVDLRLVKIGILQQSVNQSSAAQPVKGFSHYTEAIDFWIDNPLSYKAIDNLVDTLENQYCCTAVDGESIDADE